MQAYEITAPGQLALVQHPEREPGPQEIVVEVRSIALNRRDLTLVDSARSGPRSAIGLIPCSDAAGRVAVCGASVTEFEVGDAVVTRFLPDWISGRPPSRDVMPAFGGPHPGVLAERVTAAATSFARPPTNLGPNLAATLPCAALTAWRAVGGGDSLAGQWVAIVGSGGVSVFALQFATALGARVVIVTRDVTKTERLQKLGATAVLAADGPWHDQLLEITAGRGVDLSIDMGARGALSRLASVAAPGGIVSVVGVVDGMQAEIDLAPFIRRGVSLRGVNAGSRVDFAAMTQFMQARQIEPIIEAVVPFEAAADAFEVLRAAHGIGKIVIRRDGHFASPRS
jgi:NADPH:quinone reductase-like Zn-dependent oxidoreductase